MVISPRGDNTKLHSTLETINIISNVYSPCAAASAVSSVFSNNRRFSSPALLLHLANPAAVFLEGNNA
jgi:hypothetical protein